MNQKLNITDWDKADRPREKLIEKGRHVLSDAELIGILLSSGNRDETAVDLAKRILSSVDNNLNELGKLSIEDLNKFKGIGEAKAITIISALELGRRRKESDVIQKATITSSKDVYNALSHLLSDLPHEEFWILILNRANKVISKHRISTGGVSGTVIDSRIIFKIAIEQLAAGIVLAHNHPSGNVQPSDTDIRLTKQLKEAGKLLEINVLDHLIFGEGTFYSFVDEGII